MVLAAETVELLEPEHLLIVWNDGSDSLLTHREIRLACACANCIDEWTREPLLDPASVDAEVRITKVSPTGNYGLQMTFSDGHGTGIYTFERLRSLGEAPSRGASS